MLTPNRKTNDILELNTFAENRRHCSGSASCLEGLVAAQHRGSRALGTLLPHVDFGEKHMIDLFRT